MSEFLFQYEKVNPISWAYLSSLLMIALFFKFNRFWSVRNLDLILLILLAPGLLVVQAGRREYRQVRLEKGELNRTQNEAAAALWKQEELEVARTAYTEPPAETAPSSATPPSPFAAVEVPATTVGETIPDEGSHPAAETNPPLTELPKTSAALQELGKREFLLWRAHCFSPAV